jgi:hypothetical protein
MEYLITTTMLVIIVERNRILIQVLLDKVQLELNLNMIMIIKEANHKVINILYNYYRYNEFYK